MAQLTDRSGSGPLTVVFALTGQRGVGKTHLAAAYARQCIAENWPLVAWLTAESSEQLVTGLADLAEHLDLRAPDDDAAIAAKRVRKHLESRTEPGLVVIDNAVDPEDLRAHLPTGGTTHVVITTTNQAFANTADTVDVTVYTREQAVAYLTTRTRLTDSGGAAQLAEELGYLPLALAQTAWLITTQGKTYPDILDDLRTFPITELLHRADGDPYPHGMAETVLLTATQAAAIDTTGRISTVLSLLALLSPAGIPRQLFTTILANLPRPVHPRETDQILHTLALASLITYALDNTTILIHRLIQRVLRDQAAQTGTLPVLTTDLVHALHSQIIDDDQAWARRTEAAALISQITALVNHSPTRSSSERSTTSTASDPSLSEAFAALLPLRAWAPRNLITVRNYTQATSLGMDLVSDTTAVLGPEHRDTLAARSDLANAYRAAGQAAQSIELFEAVSADQHRVLGPDDPDTLSTRNNLATALRVAGRVTEAIALYEAVLTDRNRVLGPDHPDTLMTRNNLAFTYRVAGRVAESIKLFEGLLADRNRVLGPDHPDTLMNRNSLAFAYRAAGRVPEAIELFEAVLSDRQRVLGPDHPDTLITRNNVAVAYQSAGRLHDAIEVYNAVLRDRQRVLGHEHPDTLVTESHLAGCYRIAGRVAESIELYEAVLPARIRLLGLDHPDTLKCRNGLAVAYRSAGRVSDAITLYEALLADQHRIMGPDHLDTLVTRNNLAFAYREAGRVTEAVESFEALLADRLRVLGPDHPSTLITRNNLAVTLRVAGRVTEAVELFEALLADRLRVLGPDHPSTLITRSELALTYLESKRVTESIELLEAVLADQHRLLGPDHRSTLKTGASLARARQETQRRSRFKRA